MTGKPVLKRLLIAGLMLVCCLLVVSTAFAKGTGPVRATITLQNNYLKLDMDDGTGQWVLSTTGGDPAVGSDNNLALTYLGGATTFATLRVYPTRSTRDDIIGPGDVGGGTGGIPGGGTPGGGTSPGGDNGGSSSSDEIKDFELGADTSFLSAPTAVSTNEIDCLYETGDEAAPIIIAQRVILIHDTLVCTYTLTNVGTQSYTIGFRQLLDLQLGLNDGAPIKVGTQGTFTSEKEWTGGLVPCEFIAYDNANYPSVITRGTLCVEGIQRPKRFILAHGLDIIATKYDYTVTPGLGTVDDSAVAFYWDPYYLGVGDSVTFSFRYGLGYSSNDFEGDFLLSTTSPLSLRFHSGDNPATPAVENGYLSPDPFPVYAYLFNEDPVQTQTSASLTIVLPDGLELDTGEVATKLVSDIAPGHERGVTWKVKPKAGYSGQQEFRVIGSCSPGGAKNVSRDILLPATPQHDTPGGLSLISFPFKCTPADASTALGIPAGSLALYKYDPTTPGYQLYSHTAFDLEPGEGYWIKLLGPTTLSLAGSSKLFSPYEHELKLGNGWNLVGAPFPRGCALDGILVSRNGLDVSLHEAALRGWIKNVFYRWAQSDANPLVGQYEFTWSQKPGAVLEAWRGYWLKVLKDGVSLKFSEAPVVKGGNAPISKLDWQAQLAVRTSSSEDVENFFGVSSADKEGYSPGDLDEPPRGPGEDYVRAYFNDAGLQLARDVRSTATGRQVWHFTVEVGQPSEAVTVSWSDLSGIPRNLQLMLVDEATGQRTFMRTARNYVFSTQTRGATRNFSIVVEPRQQNACLVTSLVLTPNKAGGYSIAFNLAEPAQVTVKVRNLAGTVVATISQQVSGGEGLNTLTWNGLDKTGHPVPSGAYQLELVAETPNGARFNASRLIRVK